MLLALLFPGLVASKLGETEDHPKAMERDDAEHSQCVSVFRDDSGIETHEAFDHVPGDGAIEGAFRDEEDGFSDVQDEVEDVEGAIVSVEGSGNTGKTDRKHDEEISPDKRSLSDHSSEGRKGVGKAVGDENEESEELKESREEEVVAKE